jgi:hypothetical protein
MKVIVHLDAELIEGDIEKITTHGFLASFEEVHWRVGNILKANIIIDNKRFTEHVRAIKIYDRFLKGKTDEGAQKFIKLAELHFTRLSGAGFAAIESLMMQDAIEKLKDEE